MVVALRRLYPDLEIIARARDSEHQRRLNKMLKRRGDGADAARGLAAVVASLGGAVLRALNYKKEDVDGLIERGIGEIRSRIG